MTKIKIMLRVGALVYLLLYSVSALARIGLADWSDTTPYGHRINNFISTTLYLDDAQLDNLAEWYFYKSHVIGRLRGTKREDTLGFFAVNEVTQKITVFKTRAEWEDFLNQHHLKPHIFERWYQSSWGFDVGNFLLLLIYLPFISLPLLGIYLWIFYKSIIKEKFGFKRPFTLIFTAINGLFLSGYLLGRFPQSL